MQTAVDEKALEKKTFEEQKIAVSGLVENLSPIYRQKSKTYSLKVLTLLKELFSKIFILKAIYKKPILCK